MKTLVNLLVFQKPVTSAASNSPDSSHVLMSVLTMHFLDALTLPLLSDTCVLYLLFLSAPPSLNSSFISLSLPFTLLSPPDLSVSLSSCLWVGECICVTSSLPVYPCLAFLSPFQFCDYMLSFVFILSTVKMRFCP